MRASAGKVQTLIKPLQMKTLTHFHVAYVDDTKGASANSPAVSAHSPYLLQVVRI
jgi:hypothetical protein